MHAVMRSLFLLLLLGIPVCAGAEAPDANQDYQPGKGWQIPGTGFKLGGYATLALEDDRRQHTRLGVDDFSVFVHWENEGRLRLFSELDLENPVGWEGGRGLNTHRAYLALERLYADYLYSDSLNFRAGKFLTPIGRWNVIHAAPLVWTTSRPQITERTFPTNATGAMVYGNLNLLGNSFDYALYTALGGEWRPDPKLDPFEEAYGLHVTLPVANTGELGISYANFEQRGSIGERKNLLGMDYFWSRNRYELSAEAIYRFSDEGANADEKGLYIQGVAPLSARWYAVGRYERYDQAGSAFTMNLWLAGLAMRLSPAMVLKAEFSHATHNQTHVPDGLMTSFSILF